VIHRRRAGEDEHSLSRRRRLYPTLFPHPLAQPEVQAAKLPRDPIHLQMAQELFGDSDDDEDVAETVVVNQVSTEFE
jgi:hypothetical protein